jgi:hypothetical protein
MHSRSVRGGEALLTEWRGTLRFQQRLHNQRLSRYFRPQQLTTNIRTSMPRAKVQGPLEATSTPTSTCIDATTQQARPMLQIVRVAASCRRSGSLLQQLPLSPSVSPMCLWQRKLRKYATSGANEGHNRLSSLSSIIRARPGYCAYGEAEPNDAVTEESSPGPFAKLASFFLQVRTSLLKQTTEN